MMVQTAAGLTNTNGGEIDDFAALRHRPRAVRRPAQRYYRKDEHVLVSWRFIALASMFLAVLAIGS